MASLSDGGDKRINKRQRPVLAPRGECTLNAERSVMIGVSDSQCRERRKALAEVAVVRRISRREPELERYGRAYAHEAFGGEGSEYRCNDWTAQAGEDAGIDHIASTRHLVAAPRMLSGFEVEPARLAEQRNQLQAAPRRNHLVQCGIDSGAKGGRPQDCTGFARDIWINLDRCLGHHHMISAC